MFGMFLMFVLMMGCLGLLGWFIWVRLGSHLRENPQGVTALSEHLFLPLMGKKK